MVRPACRSAACAAALGVLGLAWLPAEHVHSHDEAGHATGYVHRHFQPHRSLEADAHLDHPGDEHDARYLSSVLATDGVAPRLDSDRTFAVHAPFQARPHEVSWRHRRPLFTTVHAPPWARSAPLRAPPLFPPSLN